MKIIGIIPSRYASTRFPGKPLAMINGKSMVQRVYEQTKKSKLLERVIIATDDSRIFDHVAEFGGEVMMTGDYHLNGTTRCMEVVTTLSQSGEDFDIVINIQGDEPMIDPENIDLVANLFIDNDTQIATLVKQITDIEDLFNENVVKAVLGENKKAIYFSRQAIPYVRNQQKDLWLGENTFYKHIGIYGYKVSVLQEIVDIPVGKLEKAESLEQLRWIENNYMIKADITDFESIGIDTPEDLNKLETNP